MNGTTTKVISDPGIRLEPDELRMITQAALDRLNWNGTDAGIASMEDRGYSGLSVIAGMMRDLMLVGELNGMDVLDITRRALESHAGFGSDQYEKIEAHVRTMPGSRLP